LQTNYFRLGEVHTGVYPPKVELAGSGVDLADPQPNFINSKGVMLGFVWVLAKSGHFKSILFL
jgi:hypothetical protein